MVDFSKIAEIRHNKENNKIRGFKVTLKITNSYYQNAPERFVTFTIRGTDIEDVRNYVENDYIPNEIMNRHTGITNFKGNKYTVESVQ